MKTNLKLRSNCLLHGVLCGLVAALCLLTMSARAGLTFTLDLYVTQGTYVFYTPLNTNATMPDAAMGTYNIYSPEFPTNGSWREMVYDNTGMNTVAGSENNYPNLAAALYQITNGTWTMVFSNATTTNTYHFTVSLPTGMSSNQLPVTLLTLPANPSAVTNMPTFTWSGQPTNWPVEGTGYVLQFNSTGNENFYYSEAASVTQTSFTMPCPIPASGPDDTTLFNLDYVTNYANPLFVASTPVNVSNSQTLAAWDYTTTLETGSQLQFTVVAPPSSSTNHTLIAHYTFDQGDLGADSSTNGFNLECGSGWGDLEGQQQTSDAAAGSGAVQFFGDSSITPCGTDDPAFIGWTNAMLGSFTVSAWIDTSTMVGGDTDQLQDYDGQNVVYLNNNGNGVIPLGITGSKAAIATGVPNIAYGHGTLHSTASVVTESYVFVAVTRDQGSGMEQIYINGALDSSGYGEPGILDGGCDYASIGGELSGPYTGLLDDVQIYSGVLNATEIANLYASPGSTAPNGGTVTFNTALSTTNFSWTTSGDTDWFIESTNTYNGQPYAAQSGVVINDQSSTLTVAVNGPAALTFYWSAQGSEFNDFDYEVYLDGDPNGGDLDDLYSPTPWTQDGTFLIPPGQHTVSWTTFAYGDDDPTEAGFLAQVAIVPAVATLTNPTVQDGQFQFQLSAPAGYNYDLYSTTNLASGNWTFLDAYQGGYTFNLQFPVSGNQTFYAAVPED